MLETGIIIVAAGESRRLGQPKQLLPFRGTTLLRSAAETALAARLGPVVAVLGAAEDECRKTLRGLNVLTVVNRNWRDGMGSTIAHGMSALHAHLLESVIVMLCDQPAVTSDHLRTLLHDQRQSDAQIAASVYPDGTPGPPALFTVSRFPSLLGLTGKSGARALFSESAGMITIPFPGGELDIDEPEDLVRLSRFE